MPEKRRESPSNFQSIENNQPDKHKQSEHKNGLSNHSKHAKSINDQLPALRQLKDIADRSNPPPPPPPAPSSKETEPWSFAQQSMHSPKVHSPFESKQKSSSGRFTPTNNDSKSNGLKQNNLLKPQSTKPEKMAKKESDEMKRSEKMPPEKPKPFNFMPNPFNFHGVDPSMNFSNPEMFMHNLQQSQQFKAFLEQSQANPFGGVRPDPSNMHSPYGNQAPSTSFHPANFGGGGGTPNNKMPKQEKADKADHESAMFKQMKNSQDMMKAEFDLNYHLMGKGFPGPGSFPHNLGGQFPSPFDQQMMQAKNFPAPPNFPMMPNGIDPVQFNMYQKQFQMPPFQMPGSMPGQPSAPMKQFPFERPDEANKRAYLANSNNPLAQFEQMQHQMAAAQHFAPSLNPAQSADFAAAHADALKRLEMMERDRQYKMYSANMKI